MYLTYEEYRAYGGTMAEADFTVAEFRARKLVDALTDNRVARMGRVPLSVKLAMVTIIRIDGVVGADARAEAPLAASFSTDGYSESYGSPAEQTASLREELHAGIRQMLGGEWDDEGVPLLYRGMN